MSNFITSALKNLGIKAAGRSPSQTFSRSSSRTSLRDVNFRINLDDSDESSFSQWKDAMKKVARLPDGIPPEFRKQLWLALANRYMERKKINYEKVVSTCLNDLDDPDESELGTQIVKDLHRTGCSVFSGDVAEQNQSHLKHVLLAYARWNVTVGYCQGFNMLAAIILEVVDWVESDALKVMIFLIEGVLPESYFANHLRGLSVDMAVFRDLLRMRLARLSQHLDKLQACSPDNSTGYNYEPPLTNVFTMQWFLTLFSNCLPKETVLRVWDLILLEGNEVLLRTALAIWDGLGDRIMAVESADEFYSIMGVLTREILEFGLMDANVLLKTICNLAPFPFPQLHELRDNYTYNIQPFTSSWSSSRQFHIFSGDADDEECDDDMFAASWCMTNELHLAKKKTMFHAVTPSSAFSSIGPGAFGNTDSNSLPLSFTNFNTERMTLDISALKRQYGKLKERQKQAHVILSGAFQSQFRNRSHNSLAVNHLLIGKQPLTRRVSSKGHLRFAAKNLTHGYGCNKTLAKESSSSNTATSRRRSPSSSSQASYYNESSNEQSDSFSASKASTSSSSSPYSSDDDAFEPSCSGNDEMNESVKTAETSNVPDQLPSPDESIQIDSEPHLSTPVNPFPTKRRVGSMKNKSVSPVPFQHSS